MNRFKRLSKKEKAEQIAVTVLYPLILLFGFLGKTFKLFGTKRRQITASVLSVAIVLTMLPIMAFTASAASWTEVPDGGIGFSNGYSLVNVTMPTTNGYYSYGTNTAQTKSNQSSLPSSGWTWAVKKESQTLNGNTYNYTLTLNNFNLSYSGSDAAFVVRTNARIQLVGTNVISTTSANLGVSIGNNKYIYIDGNGSLDVTAKDYGFGGDDDCITLAGGSITVKANYLAFWRRVKILNSSGRASASRDINGSGPVLYRAEDNNLFKYVKFESSPAAVTPVEYIDASGVTRTCTNYMVVENSTSVVTWTSGWYVVNRNVTMDQMFDVSGEVHLILMDGCTLTANSRINVDDDNKLTIYGQSRGTGTVTTARYGGSWSSGIGSGLRNKCGMITINGGTVVANSSGGAGIGGGQDGDGGTVIINGGTVTAIGTSGAGIGAGCGGQSGTVIINGGTVTAEGSYSGAGIGDGGNDAGQDGISSGGIITINGGNITASGTGWAAGIGGDYMDPCGTININGGTINAKGGENAPGIGAGYKGTGGTLNIARGATIMAGAFDAYTPVSTYGSERYVKIDYDARYIDQNSNLQFCKEYTVLTSSTTAWKTGWYVLNSNVTLSSRVSVSGDVHLILMDGYKLTASRGINIAGSNSLTVYGQNKGTGTVIAKGGNWESGIGGVSNQAGGAITINGGIVSATGGSSTAGIGGGANGAGGTVTINGGTVTATAGSSSAAIGHGSNSAGGTITINGGAVTAIGVDGQAAIGDSKATISIAPGTVIMAGGSAPGNLVDAYSGQRYVSVNFGTPGIDYEWESNVRESTLTIKTRAGLLYFEGLVNNKSFNFKGCTVILANDITEAYTGKPIGSTFSKGFQGTFNGNGHSIALNMVKEKADALLKCGLFGFNRGTIKNLTVTGTVSNTYGTDQSGAGAIAGENDGTIEKCVSTADITGCHVTGGISGRNNGIIRSCYTSGTIVGKGVYNGSGNAYAAGIAGYTYSESSIGISAVIENCYTTATSSATTNDTKYASGITGGMGSYTTRTATVKNNYYKNESTDIANTGYTSFSNCLVTGNEKKTDTAFASGEVAYLLNGSTSTGTLRWYQNLKEDKDACPVLDNTHDTVYLVDGVYGGDPTYTVTLKDGSNGTVKQNGADVPGSSATIQVKSGQNLADVMNEQGYSVEAKSLYSVNQIEMNADIKVVEVCTGDGFTVLLDENGDMWTLGSNASGKLGYEPVGSNSNTPEKVTAQGLGKVIQISARGEFTVALDENGDVWTFGRNNEGQLGYKTEQSYNAIPKKVVATGLGKVAQISAGKFFTVLLDENNAVWTFGYAFGGALGYSTEETSVYEPRKINTSEIGAITQISSGSYHSVLLDSFGNAWSFGYNNQGRLGYTTETNDNPSPKKITATGLNRVVQVAAAFDCTVLLDASGQVWGFGQNVSGMLCREADGATPQIITAEGLGKAVQVSAGQHLLIVDENGDVWSSGWSRFGELGYYAYSETNNTLKKITTNIAGNAVRASAGLFHSGVITKGGKVWMFGRNNVGQLGDAEINISYYTGCYTPTLLTFANTGTSVASFSDITVTSNMIVTPGYKQTSWSYGTDYAWSGVEKASNLTIKTLKGLNYFADLVNNQGASFSGYTVTLANDITEAYTGTPIGSTYDLGFKGTFDGGGHSVNLNMVKTDADALLKCGLFGYNRGTIKNVTVTGTVSNAYAKSQSGAGGIAGENDGTIEKCVSTANVTGCHVTGGISGRNNGIIRNCYTSGTIVGKGVYNGSGNAYAAGIAGYTYSESSIDISAVIENCYTTATSSATTSDTKYASGITGGKGSASGYTVTIQNNFYLNESTDISNTANTGTNIVVKNNVKKTAAQFASGEVCYLLNGSTSQGTLSWFQNVDSGTKDATPVLDSTHGTVYKITSGYSNTEVVVIDTWKKLQDAINKGGEIKLTQDIEATANDTQLKVLSGVTVTIDLYGKTIDRALTSAVDNGSVFYIDGGNLTITDTSTTDVSKQGKITGGNTTGHGGGVYLNSGTFTMEGGSITGNTASQYGGGVYMNGTFNMQGGSITGNTAVYGGGVNNNNGTFNMKSGSITGNTASTGGGLYNYNLFNVSGSATIKDNTLTGSITKSNVYLPQNKYFTVIGALTGEIGVNTESTTYPITVAKASTNPVYNITASDLAKLVSDVTTLELKLESGNVVLKESVVYSVDISWGAMEFTYSEGTWNPGSHEYENGGWAANTADGNKITVKNNSTVAVTAAFSYAKAETAFSGSFTDSASQAASSLSLPVGGTKEVYYILSGTPTSALDKKVLGTVTVTIG